MSDCVDDEDTAPITGHDEDLAFMAWVKAAPMRELAKQLHYAYSWQRVAIDREMQRRIKR